MIHMHTQTLHTYTHAHTHRGLFIYICIYLYVYIYTYQYAQKCIYTYTRTPKVVRRPQIRWTTAPHRLQKSHRLRYCRWKNFSSTTAYASRESQWKSEVKTEKIWRDGELQSERESARERERAREREEQRERENGREIERERERERESQRKRARKRKRNREEYQCARERGRARESALAGVRARWSRAGAHRRQYIPQTTSHISMHVHRVQSLFCNATPFNLSITCAAAVLALNGSTDFRVDPNVAVPPVSCAYLASVFVCMYTQSQFKKGRAVRNRRERGAGATRRVLEMAMSSLWAPFRVCLEFSSRWTTRLGWGSVSQPVSAATAIHGARANCCRCAPRPRSGSRY